MNRIQLFVPTMACEHCVKSIEGALNGLPALSQVSVDLSTKKVTVSYDDTVTINEIIQIIEDEGFDVETL